jgi:hypothetical protein
MKRFPVYLAIKVFLNKKQKHRLLPKEKPVF